MPVLTSRATRAGLVLATAALTAAAAWKTHRLPIPGAAGLSARYGAAVALGNGQARTYVLTDPRSGRPVEVGVALSADALDSLPRLSPEHAPGTHGPSREYLLELPAGNPTPYRFVEVDWNPLGHGGPYTAPHFDFHFYRVPLAVRNEIVLEDPAFAEKAARLPAADEMPAGYVSTHVLLKTTPAGMTVPRMGLHWLDVKSPELPPANRPFTATFIVGSWNGQVIFDEPMVTRDFILAQRTGPASADSIPLPQARRYLPAGYYPVSYGVRWDAAAQEYRIALQGLTPRD
ncbi:MAG TPA: DUF5602 domain-containing protein [Gemmatimonadales bacterium]|jgi:hypothetical protein|nr:DUF5602 domain-containing protein [Gemmatimonadales bacterium]